MDLWEKDKWLIVVAITNTNTGIFTVISTFHSFGFFFYSIIHYGTLGTIQSNHNFISVRCFSTILGLSFPQQYYGLLAL